MLHPRRIELFHAVMAHGGVSRAAAALRIAQPGISRAMAALEAELGFRLFQRVNGRVSATPEAEAFHREVERSFIGLDRLRLAAQDIRTFGTGRLRICCLTALSKQVMARALHRFMAKNPGATVSLQVRTSATVWELTAGGQCDLGIAGPKTGFAGVTAQPFLALPGVLALPAGHKAARRSVLGPREVAECDFVTLVPEDSTRMAIERAFAALGLVPRVRVETQYSATVCTLVAAGLGVGLVNPLVAEEHRHLPLVFRRFRPDILFESLLLLPSGRPHSQLVERFVTCLRAEVGGFEGAQAGDAPGQTHARAESV